MHNNFKTNQNLANDSFDESREQIKIVVSNRGQSCSDVKMSVLIPIISHFKGLSVVSENKQFDAYKTDDTLADQFNGERDRNLVKYQPKYYEG